MKKLSHRLFWRFYFELFTTNEMETFENEIEISIYKLELTERISTTSKEIYKLERDLFWRKQRNENDLEALHNVTNHPELYIKKPKQIQ